MCIHTNKEDQTSTTKKTSIAFRNAKTKHKKQKTTNKTKAFVNALTQNHQQKQNTKTNNKVFLNTFTQQNPNPSNQTKTNKVFLNTLTQQNPNMPNQTKNKVFLNTLTQQNPNIPNQTKTTNKVFLKTLTQQNPHIPKQPNNNQIKSTKPYPTSHKIKTTKHPKLKPIVQTRNNITTNKHQVIHQKNDRKDQQESNQAWPTGLAQIHTIKTKNINPNKTTLNLTKTNYFEHKYLTTRNTNATKHPQTTKESSHIKKYKILTTTNHNVQPRPTGPSQKQHNNKYLRITNIKNKKSNEKTNTQINTTNTTKKNNKHTKTDITHILTTLQNNTTIIKTKHTPHHTLIKTPPLCNTHQLKRKISCSNTIKTTNNIKQTQPNNHTLNKYKQKPLQKTKTSNHLSKIRQERQHKATHTKKPQNITITHLSHITTQNQKTIYKQRYTHYKVNPNPLTSPLHTIFKNQNIHIKTKNQKNNLIRARPAGLAQHQKNKKTTTTHPHKALHKRISKYQNHISNQNSDIITTKTTKNYGTQSTKKQKNPIRNQTLPLFLTNGDKKINHITITKPPTPKPYPSTILKTKASTQQKNKKQKSRGNPSALKLIYYNIPTQLKHITKQTKVKNPNIFKHTQKLKANHQNKPLNQKKQKTKINKKYNTPPKTIITKLTNTTPNPTKHKTNLPPTQNPPKHQNNIRKHKVYTKHLKRTRPTGLVPNQIKINNINNNNKIHQISQYKTKRNKKSQIKPKKHPLHYIR